MYTEEFKARVRAAYPGKAEEKHLDNMLESGSFELGRFLRLGSEEYRIVEEDIVACTDTQQLALLHSKAEMIVNRRTMHADWVKKVAGVYVCDIADTPAYSCPSSKHDQEE